MSFKVEEKVVWTISDSIVEIEMTKLGDGYAIQLRGNETVDMLELIKTITAILKSRGEDLIHLYFDEDNNRLVIHRRAIMTPRIR